MPPTTVASVPSSLPGHLAGEPPTNGAGLPLAGIPDDLLQALQAVRVGDFSVRLPSNQTGLIGKIADTFNDIVAANQRMAQQLERVGQVVGRDGKTRQRVRLGLATGAWADMEVSINNL